MEQLKHSKLSITLTQVIQNVYLVDSVCFKWVFVITVKLYYFSRSFFVPQTSNRNNCDVLFIYINKLINNCTGSSTWIKQEWLEQFVSHRCALSSLFHSKDWQTLWFKTCQPIWPLKMHNYKVWFVHWDNCSLEMYNYEFWFHAWRQAFIRDIQLQAMVSCIGKVPIEDVELKCMVHPLRQAHLEDVEGQCMVCGLRHYTMADVERKCMLRGLRQKTIQQVE